MIGLVTTAIAIGLLFFLVFTTHLVEFGNRTDYLLHIIPRITLALFVESFSFFFLRLYKVNLDDVKYFYNERTNIESKIIALKIAQVQGDKDIIKEVVRSYYNVERNFVLKKGESTIGLENGRMESQQAGDILSKLKIADIIKAIKD